MRLKSIKISENSLLKDSSTEEKKLKGLSNNETKKKIIDELEAARSISQLRRKDYLIY